MKLLVTVLLLIISVTAFAQPKGSLETPKNGSYVSGKYMFSGWICDADLVEVVIDGGSGLTAAYGTSRGDTLSNCGDTDNGFGLLVNMSELGDGEHEAALYADGQLITRNTFTVTRLSTGNFLRGAQALAIEPNFPDIGQEIWLEWVESTQNFMITREQVTPDPLDVSGGWYSDALDAGAVITTSRFYVEREDMLIMVAYDGGWEIYEGYLQGVEATVQTLGTFGPNVTATVNFSGTTEGVITVDSCTSANGYTCAFSAGAKIAIRKIAGNNAGASTGQDEVFNLTPIGNLTAE